MRRGLGLLLHQALLRLARPSSRAIGSWACGVHGVEGCSVAAVVASNIYILESASYT
jgi:hypothetical protein